MKKRIGDLKPGTLFEAENELFGKRSTSVCLKLENQKVVNLDANALWSRVDQSEMVEVLDKKLMLLTNDEIDWLNCEINPNP